MTPLDTRHRPWPSPDAPWAIAMSWHDLLFLHWPVAASALRPHIPALLSIDTFDGWAWLGVVPFRMTGVRPRYAPRAPWLSAFPELNVRTYVTIGGKPGVWFFSLDAANPVAVWLARVTFHLPYMRARMSLREKGGEIHYTSLRTHRGEPPARFEARYGPMGEARASAAGTIVHFLTERYCLYAADRARRVFRGDIHHAPWPLQPARAEVAVNEMASSLGVRLSGPPAHVHFARRLDVVSWGLVRAS
jgi:uncharacterized protein YqjF (DUF2071 family)